MKHTLSESGDHLQGAQVYRRLLHMVGRYWWMLFIGILGTIAVSGLDAEFTYLVKPIIDEGFVNRSPRFIFWIPFLLSVIFVLRSAGSFVSKYWIARAARSVVMSLRQNVFEHLMRIPASYYDQKSSGYLLSTIVYNVEQVANASSDALITILREGTTVVGMVVVMFVLSWRLSFLMVIVAPAMAILIRFCSKRLRHLSHKVQESVGDVTHVAEEGIEAYQEIRLYGGEKKEIETFANVTNVNRQRELKVVITNSLNSALIQLFIALPAIVAVAISTSYLMLSAGSFASIVMAMFGLLRPARRLTDVNSTIQKGIAGAASVFALLDQPAEKNEGTYQLPRAEGHVEYRHVSFAYNSSKSPVLNDITIEVKPGQTVAFVGRSGSGKSTLMKLLPRFYEISSGEILVDGHNLPVFELTNLRKQFAFVSQHPVLFNKTVAYNIAYGREGDDVSEAEIIEAAEAAHAMEFIQMLPEGIHTLIGENGVLLSGGQRQRIAIARALIKDAPILLLDEATSALDTHAERQIQAALDQLMQNRTTLIIAHRLSTIENADRIYMMENGRMIEEGTHKVLLTRGGAYAQLYRMQFKDEDRQAVA
ncbi:MAG TPA: lipid A export permease/ATP-binding protein MsbA [Coxiellaceae bacterium]|nr:lipid A export permease/ATP-binding protein MsbA [Coxiellaceae bacterium]